MSSQTSVTNLKRVTETSTSSPCPHPINGRDSGLRSVLPTDPMGRIRDLPANRARSCTITQTKYPSRTNVRLQQCTHHRSSQALINPINLSLLDTTFPPLTPAPPPPIGGPAPKTPSHHQHWHTPLDHQARSPTLSTANTQLDTLPFVLHNQSPSTPSHQMNRPLSSISELAHYLCSTYILTFCLSDLTPFAE